MILFFFKHQNEAACVHHGPLFQGITQKTVLIKKNLSVTFNTILPPPKQSNSPEHRGEDCKGETATEDKPSVVTIQTVAMEMSKLIAHVAFPVSLALDLSLIIRP